MSISIIISLGFIVLFLTTISFMWYMCRTACCSFNYDDGSAEHPRSHIYYIGTQSAFGLPRVFDILPNRYDNARSRQRQDSSQRLEDSNSTTSTEEFNGDVSPSPSPGPPPYESLDVVSEEKPPPPYEDVIINCHI